jgi:hypothetical protein
VYIYPVSKMRDILGTCQTYVPRMLLARTTEFPTFMPPYENSRVRDTRNIPFVADCELALCARTLQQGMLQCICVM